MKPNAAVAYSGDELFAGLDATVKEFWAYAMRDLRTNTTRGLLAEWLVAKAVGASPHEEWESFDVLTPDGVRVEVKASAYLQSWEQRRLSTISFSRLKGQRWSGREGYAGEQSYNADVYVFCVQTAKSHEDYDPLELSQWEFYVVPSASVESTGYSTIGLPTLLTLTAGPTEYGQLAGAITTAAAAGKSDT
jgi:hypothetical protein